MLWIVLLFIGIAGFGAAAYLDLKTTEFPDWVPYLIIATALSVRGIYSLLSSDFSAIINSVIFGVIFLGFGMMMYYTKQWGDGDAWLLGSLGFLFPDSAGFATAETASRFAALPFPAAMLFNFFFISFFYLIAYSLYVGFSNPKVSGQFFRYLKGNSRGIVTLIAVFSAMCIGFFIYMHLQFSLPLSQLPYAVMFSALFAALILFLHYGKFVENRFFRKRIDAKNLRPGDVPLDKKWKVLSGKEVASLKRKGGKIWIKEGVRFAPVFIITMLVTLIWGNFAFLLLFV